MKRLINGIEKLNRYHFQLSQNWIYNRDQIHLSYISYINDLEYENHEVKSLKYKQFLYINRKHINR